MQPLLVISSFAGLFLSWWLPWGHLLTWIPSTILYSIMLSGLRAGAGKMVAGAVSPERLRSLSPSAISWLHKNGHAILMWGASTVMAQRLKSVVSLAVISISITGFRHSAWWFIELIAICVIVLPLHDGFAPINKDKLAEIDAVDSGSYIVTEIVPLAREIIEADVSRQGF